MSRFDAGLLERARRAVAAWSAAPAPAVVPEAAADTPAGLVEQALPLVMGLCKRFEGFSAHPYLDAAGVPTIGHGATHYLTGRAVRLTDPPISRETAEYLLREQLRREFVPAVLRLCARADTPGRMAALADFCFNLGAGRLAASTLRRRVAAGDWDDARVELLKWVYGGGRRLHGLERRREAECALL
jgi:lysozyme